MFVQHLQLKRSTPGERRRRRSTKHSAMERNHTGVHILLDVPKWSMHRNKPNNNMCMRDRETIQRFWQRKLFLMQVLILSYVRCLAVFFILSFGRFVTLFLYGIMPKTNNYYKSWMKEWQTGTEKKIAEKRTGHREIAHKLHTYWAHNNNNAVLWTSIAAAGMCTCNCVCKRTHDTSIARLHRVFLRLSSFRAIFSFGAHWPNRSNAERAR